MLHGAGEPAEVILRLRREAAGDTLGRREFLGADDDRPAIRDLVGPSRMGAERVSADGEQAELPVRQRFGAESQMMIDHAHDRDMLAAADRAADLAATHVDLRRDRMVLGKVTIDALSVRRPRRWW